MDQQTQELQPRITAARKECKLGFAVEKAGGFPSTPQAAAAAATATAGSEKALRPKARASEGEERWREQRIF